MPRHSSFAEANRHLRQEGRLTSASEETNGSRTIDEATWQTFNGLLLELDERVSSGQLKPGDPEYATYERYVGAVKTLTDLEPTLLQGGETKRQRADYAAARELIQSVVQATPDRAVEPPARPVSEYVETEHREIPLTTETPEASTQPATPTTPGVPAIREFRHRHWVREHKQMPDSMLQEIADRIRDHRELQGQSATRELSPDEQRRFDWLTTYVSGLRPEVVGRVRQFVRAQSRGRGTIPEQSSPAEPALSASPEAADGASPATAQTAELTGQAPKAVEADTPSARTVQPEAAAVEEVTPTVPGKLKTAVEAAEERMRRESDVAKADLPPESTTSTKTKTTPDRRRAAVVDISGMKETVARHRAEERLQSELRGESADGRKRGWLGRMAMKWSRHAGEQGWRELYITQEKERLQRELEGTDPNLFAPDERTPSAFRKERQAIIDRFMADFDQAVRTNEGERRETLADASSSDAIRTLIARRVNDETDDATFQREKEAILAQLQAAHPAVFEKERATIDNLLDVARDIKASLHHGQRVAAMDIDLDVQLGRHRSAIKGEANLGAFDRLVKRVQKIPVLNKVFTPAVLGFTASLATVPLRSVAGLFARTHGLAAPVAGAVVGAGYGAIRRGAELKGDLTHVRRATAMGYKPEAGARRIERLREFVTEQASVKDISTAISDAFQKLERSDLPPAEQTEQLQTIVNQIANAEARMDRGVATNRDYLRYEDPTQIERGRLHLLRTVAEAKVKLRTLDPTLAVHGRTLSDLDAVLERRRQATDGELRGTAEDLDRRFARFRRLEIAKAALYGATTGFIAGSVAQVGINWFREHVLHHDQVPQSAMEKAMRAITGQDAETIKGAHGAGGPDQWPQHVKHLGGRIRMLLPRDVDMVETPGQPGFVNLVDERGRMLYEPFQPDLQAQTIPESVKAQLLKDGWYVGERDVTQFLGEKKSLSPQEWMEGFAKGTKRIARDLWYDNNTPRVFDLNELKLHWGGVKGTGLDEHGNYVFNILKMKPDQSFHGHLSTDAQDLIKRGGVKIALSLSRETQKMVYEVPIDLNGNAVIDPKSEIGQLLFRNVGGRAEYLGRFAEVAEYLRDRDGNFATSAKGEQLIRMLATHEGKGLTGLTIDQLKDTDRVYDLLHPNDGQDWELPPVIPMSRRNPLERFVRQAERPPYWDSGYFRDDGRNRERWENERSPRLRENPDAALNQRQEVDWYFDRQRQERGQEYLRELDQFVDGNEALRNLPPETRRIVVMPVAAAHEHANIYNTLELYAQQSADDRDQSVVLMNVNWPDDADMSAVTKTLEEIDRAKRDFPELRVAYFKKEWKRDWITDRDGQIYGTVVKYLNDTALRAIDRAKIGHDVYLLTNDADARGLSLSYFAAYRKATERDPQADGFLGKLEWGTETFERYPGFHVAARMMQFVDTVYRHGSGPRKNVASSGANFMVKASTYAAVGGYDGEMGAGADTDLGKRIKAARYGRRETLPESRYPLKYVNAAWVDTDPSRALELYRAGIPVIKMWDRFNEGGYKPRGEMVVDGTEENLETDFTDVVRRIEFQVSESVRQWVGFDDRESYTKAMDLIVPPVGGRRAWAVERDEASGDQQIVFTDEGKQMLRERLATYRDQQRKDVLYRSRGVRAGRAVRPSRGGAAFEATSTGPVESTTADDPTVGADEPTVAETASATLSVSPAERNTSPARGKRRERTVSPAPRESAADRSDAEQEPVNTAVLRAALRAQKIPDQYIPSDDRALVEAYRELKLGHGYEDPKLIRHVLRERFGIPGALLSVLGINDASLVEKMAAVERAVRSGVVTAAAKPKHTRREVISTVETQEVPVRRLPRRGRTAKVDREPTPTSSTAG